MTEEELKKHSYEELLEMYCQLAAEMRRRGLCEDASNEITQLYNRPILAWSSYGKSTRRSINRTSTV